MKKINFYYLFQSFFYFAFSAFIFNLLKNDSYLLYIHVKFKPLLIFAIILFLLVGFINLFNITKRENKNKSIFFMFLLLPLLVYSYPERSSNVIAMREPELKKLNDNSDDMLKKALEEASKMDDEITEEKKDVDYKNLTATNFVDAIEYIYNNPNLEGEEINVKGLLFNFTEDLPKPYYVGRLLMYCCAADALPIGFFIDDPKDLKDYNGWVSVKGNLTYVTGDENYIYLKVKEIKKEEPEINMYVYPNVPYTFEVN